MAYYHSVTLDKERCRGCTNCLQHCPTEAIRVRGGKAKIIKERCIDCGECIRVCPYRAKRAVTDSFDILNDYEYNIALPAPALYGQFGSSITADKVLTGLLEIGFDNVFEVARAAEYVSSATKKILDEGKIPEPIISSACPAVIRLISVRFPGLIDHVINLLSPMEIAAKMARKEAIEKTGLPDEKIGVFFITPCPAKMTSIKASGLLDRSAVSGAISVNDIYAKLLAVMKHIEPKHLAKAGFAGISWARRGGESYGTGIQNYIVVDGIQNVINILSAIEDEKLTDVKFAELLACPGGCVGGALNVTNSYVCINNIKNIASAAGESEPVNDVDPEIVKWEKKLYSSDVMNLDTDLARAVEKMEQIERMCETLPHLDCGSCGAPTCRALSEDIVLGFANEYDCIFKRREHVKELTRELYEIAERHKKDGSKMTARELERSEEISIELYELEERQ
ncbi:MAG: [Fe-Fe] hydrogenase large subunit C-terminal domain-containing protein [Bacillota bacterium]|nr:[Fe-Fe] hydrogenase large subunit C-terminal domain-containing protein [Bacillota bacterium]